MADGEMVTVGFGERVGIIETLGEAEGFDDVEGAELACRNSRVMVMLAKLFTESMLLTVTVSRSSMTPS